MLFERAPLHGLASCGAAGVSEALALTMDEKLISLRWVGCRRISDLGPAFVGCDDSHAAGIV
jgi:hypothetical protein